MSVYKFIPVDYYNISAVESWLADMARSGYFICRFRRSFAEFEKGEPQEARYRLEPAVGKNRKSVSEMREQFEKSGWEYITSYRSYFDLYAAADESAEELHTDPVVQSYTFDAVGRHAGSAAAFFLIATLAVLVILAAGYFISDWPILLAVENTFTLQLLLILAYIIAGIRLLDEWKGFRQLKKQLKNGIAMAHETDYKKSLLPRLLTDLAALAAAVLACLVVSVYLTGSWTKDLSAAQMTESLPDFCLLEELEGNGTKLDYYGSDGISQYNTISRNWSFLAPVRYNLSQGATAENRNWKNESLAYSPSLQIQYYRLRFSWMSDLLLEDLIERYTVHHYVSAGLTRQEVSAPGLDRIVLVEDGANTSFLFCRNGKTVIMMQYYGEAVLSDYLGQIAEMAAAQPAGSR